MISHTKSFAVTLLLVLSHGCAQDAEPPSAGTQPKTTDEIGEFDPNAGAEVVDSKVKVSNSITYAVDAYQPLSEQVNEIPVIQGIQLFQASEGRYPKDHDEFMTRVIKENNIRLPVLNNGKRYEYDVENHKLMIVRDAPPK